METKQEAPKIGDRVATLVNRRYVPIGSVGVVVGVEMGRVYRVRFEDGRQDLFAAWQVEVMSDEASG